MVVSSLSMPTKEKRKEIEGSGKLLKEERKKKDKNFISIE